MPTRLRQKKGFTIIELLVVLAIIGIMESIAMVSIRVARQKGLVARANADMYTLRTAILQLEGNSAKFPNHLSSASCVENVAAVLLDNSGPVGIVQNDSGAPYPNWQGPYMSAVPNDPWLTAYRFNKWATCNGQEGCSGIANGTRVQADRKSTRLNSSHSQISYAVFFFNDTATTEIYTLSLHDALPI